MPTRQISHIVIAANSLIVSACIDVTTLKPLVLQDEAFVDRMVERLR